MHVRSLTLESFRSYAKAELPCDGSCHVFVGENGSGKTNILEALSIASLTKSFLGVEDDVLRQWGAMHFRVVADITSDAGEERTLELVAQVEPRVAKAGFLSGVKLPLSSLVGVLPTVVFLPQMTELFRGAPAERRRFLDAVLCQVSPEYFQALVQYQKVLKQRNALLKAIAAREVGVDQLPVWDAALAPLAARITLLRLELTEMFSMTLPQEVAALGERWSEVVVTYQRSTTARDLPALTSELLELLTRHRDRDLAMQTTSVGPHREDWQVCVEGRSLPDFASRGQQRTVLLALLFLQTSYLTLRRGERPIILLDDLYSELDLAHCQRVTEAMSGHQVFLTATEVPESLRRERITLWNVAPGNVSRQAGVRVQA